MEYELKPKKVIAIITMIFSTGFLALSIYAAYNCLVNGDMIDLVYAMVYVVLGGLLFLVSFNKMGKGVTFNNVSLTYNGKTYTYQQIERIGSHGGRFGRIYYTVYIEGKPIYRFERIYDCAREFLYYLDFYKVPGAPRI